MTDMTRIGFSDEQAQLLTLAEDFCRDKSPVETVRRLMGEEAGFDRAVWDEMVSLGWLGIAVPESFGGSGLGLGEVVTVVEPMGRALMSGPLVPTTLTAQALLHGGTDAQQAAWLPRLCSGAIGTLALTEPHGDWDLAHLTARATRRGGDLVLSGEKRFVLDAASADVIIVSVALDGAPALVLLERTAVSAHALRRETVIDETKRSYALSLDGITVPQSQLLDPARAAATLSHVDMAANLLLAADMCGGTASVIAYTVDYLKTRKQFGRLIGSYQALKHPMADALLAYELARSHLYHAAYVAHTAPAGPIAVRMAKAQACQAYAFAADRAIQFHGGFGFTYDCDAQLYRRRALWGQHQHGDDRYHRKHLAAALLDG